MRELTIKLAKEENNCREKIGIKAFREI